MIGVEMGGCGRAFVRSLPSQKRDVGHPGVVLVRSLVRGGHGQLVGPVGCYMAAIGTLVVLATNVAVPAEAVGAVLFLGSDTVLALDRFVRPVPGGQLAVHVTYHLARSPAS